MKPYRTFLGDCVQGMQSLPAESIDLVVTSPPYDNLRTYNGTLDWSFEKFQEIAAELNRVLKPGGVIVWVVGDATVKGSETGSSFRQALHFMSLGLNLHDTMIWNKQEFSAVGALKTRYAPVFEYMFILSKGTPKTFNPIKDRPNKSFGRTIVGTNRLANGGTKPMTSTGTVIKEFGQRFNVWEMTGVKSRKDCRHPAPFPIQIAEDHILSWSNEGDTVLDPFMGSGTTGVAAIQNNRRFIGTEIVPEYYEISRQRLAEAVK
jgi:DNA modification methylase